MFREAEIYLFEWFKRTDRKPMLIRGARQVGKSTLVKRVSEHNRIKLVEINLEKNLHLEPLFRKFEISKLLKEFESSCGHPIDKSCLIFIDEIQAIPEAIQCLRYFYEERPELPVVSAGSLVEFALTRKNISFPVGRLEYLYLGPMSFNEFLLARNEDNLSKELRSFTISNYLSLTSHQRLVSLLREYLLIGGMPEVVKSYSTHGSLSKVSEIQLNLIQNYQDDFNKYAQQEGLAEMVRVFRQISGQVGEKTIYSKIDRELKAIKIKNYLELFAKAQIVSRCFYTAGEGLPLAASEDLRIFKTFMVDVGLLCNLKNIRDLSENELQSVKFINEGRIAEQFIAQHLSYAGGWARQPELYYWLNEGRSGNSQLDFIFSASGKIVPIEVKSGAAGSMKSIFYFCAIKGLNQAVRFDLNQPRVFKAKHLISTPDGSSRDIKIDILSLPLYMVGELPRLLSEFLIR